MQKSESIKELCKALITFHVKCDKINKDAKNPFYNKKYASLSNILDTINTPLNESGLSFVQLPSGEHSLITLLMHTSGEWILSDYTMKPTKDDPQGIGSAITYQRRYALSAILGLNIDDDDDANEASKPVIEKKKAVEVAREVNGDDNKPWLNKTDPLYPAIIKHLQAGTKTIQQVAGHYKLNKAIRAELEACTKELIEEAPF